MKKIARFLSFSLVFVMLLGTLTIPTQAAVAWPSMSSSAYCEFTAAKTIYVYRNTACTTRGTVSPAKSYNAYIDPGDVCKIYQITSSYIQVAYPTSSGYKIGYIKRGDVFSVSAPTRVTTATGKATSYKTAGGASYGYFESGDKVYAVGTSGNYTGVIYTAKSGSRAWKFGWVTTANYNSYAGVASTPNNNTNTGVWKYPMTNAYVCGNDWLEYYAPKKPRPYHLGLDLASRSGDTNIYAAAAGTVAAVGKNSANGIYVVIKHNFSGRTVYSFYGHLKSYTAAVGNAVNAGTKIGVFGNSGTETTGAHLHFAIANRLENGTYYGYGTTSSGNTASYGGTTFYNPRYVIQYQKLP